MELFPHLSSALKNIWLQYFISRRFKPHLLFRLFHRIYVSLPPVRPNNNLLWVFLSCILNNDELLCRFKNSEGKYIINNYKYSTMQYRHYLYAITKRLQKTNFTGISRKIHVKWTSRESFPRKILRWVILKIIHYEIYRK